MHGVLLGWRKRPERPDRLGVIYGLYTLAALVALVLIVVTLVSVFRNPGISGGEKAVWVFATIFFPFLGSLVYFTVRRGW